MLDDAAQTPARLREAFGKLSPAQLNWKPNAETWSVGECIDHLINTNRSYFGQLEAISRGDKYVSFWEKLPLFHGMWGRMLLKITAPEIKRKGKTTKPFHPARSAVSPEILAEFAQQQELLITCVAKTDLVNHHETMITSPASSFITYSLHDAVTILFQHELRHINQGLALMARPDFPKA